MNCPKCGSETEQDMVDIGVGMTPCGPSICTYCAWVEPFEDWKLDDTHDLV